MPDGEAISKIMKKYNIGVWLRQNLW
jgi:hypothetical protein